MENYCVFKACSMISVLFSTYLLLHILFFSVQLILFFFTKHTIKFKYSPLQINVKLLIQGCTNFPNM